MYKVCVMNSDTDDIEFLGVYNDKEELLHDIGVLLKPSVYGCDPYRLTVIAD